MKKKVAKEVLIMIGVFVVGIFILAVIYYLEERQEWITEQVDYIEEPPSVLENTIYNRDVLKKRRARHILHIEETQQDLWKKAFFVFILGYPALLILRSFAKWISKRIANAKIEE